MADSLSSWTQGNTTVSTPLATNVSQWLDLYHSQTLSTPPSLLLVQSKREPVENPNSSVRKNMLQSYADLIASYEYGLAHITTIQDFTQGHAPDNIMEGNFPSIPLENVKRNNPPPSSSSTT